MESLWDFVLYFGDPGASKTSPREAFPPGVASICLKQVLDIYSSPTAGELEFALHQNDGI